MPRSNNLELTTELLTPYVGGQAEVQNENEAYLFRGDIKNISVEGHVLNVEFDWLAKGEGFPPLPHRWVLEENRNYQASLELFSTIKDGREPHHQAPDVLRYLRRDRIRTY